MSIPIVADVVMPFVEFLILTMAGLALRELQKWLKTKGASEEAQSVTTRLYGVVDDYTPVTNQSLALLALTAAGASVPADAVTTALDTYADQDLFGGRHLPAARQGLRRLKARSPTALIRARPAPVSRLKCSTCWARATASCPASCAAG